MAPLASDGAFRPRTIRRADQSDLAVVQGISADAYIAAYVPVLGYIPLPAEEDYGPRIERGEVWLLACGDGDVGVAVLEEHRDHLLVYSVAVRPTEQGKGHGGALLDFADRRAAFTTAVTGAVGAAGYPVKGANPAEINTPLMIAVLTYLAILVTMVYGPIAAALVELFPTRIRYTGMSLPYHIGNGWFGGLLPPIAVALVAATGNIYAGLWYPIVIAAMTFIVGTI